MSVKVELNLSAFSLFLNEERQTYHSWANKAADRKIKTKDKKFYIIDSFNESFLKVVNSPKNVLTYNFEPIYSNKAVVLYQNGKNEFHYLFNSDHGMLSIDESFKAIFNSGQTWKFKDMEILMIANDNFKENLIEDTNLAIIQKYFDLLDNEDDIELIGLKHWVNCNKREDYKLINNYWRINHEDIR